MSNGFFPYPEQFIIHYSLMISMFQLILTAVDRPCKWTVSKHRSCKRNAWISVIFSNDNSLWASQDISRLCGSRSHLRKTVIIGVCPVPDLSLFWMILIIFPSSMSSFPKRSLPFRIAYQNFIFAYHISCACCMSAHLFLTNVLFFTLQAILTTNTVNFSS
jgi:hypothetical protein